MHPCNHTMLDNQLLTVTKLQTDFWYLNFTMAGMVLNNIPKFNSLKFSLQTVRLEENYQIVHSM